MLNLYRIQISNKKLVITQSVLYTLQHKQRQLERLSDKHVSVDDLSVGPEHQSMGGERHSMESVRHVIRMADRQVFRFRRLGIGNRNRPVQTMAVRTVEGN